MSEIAVSSWATRLRALTPARVGLARTGMSQQTREQLEFQRAHALARDAIHARLEMATLATSLQEISGERILRLHSMAADRATYLQRPDLGRQLDERSKAALAGASSDVLDLAVVVADGLSALAVERHAAALLRELLLRLEGWRLAPICVAHKGRVAIGDEIGAALGAQLCLVLIGERPGLSAPDSLGAYVTWAPRVGRTDAERNCVSNIRTEGLRYAQAAEQLFSYLMRARRQKLTGVALKESSHRIGGSEACD